MTVPGNLSSPLLATAADAAAATANITKSLRFNDPDTASLSKTFSSAGNRKTWTWSCWAKRGNDDSSQLLLSTNNGSGTYTEIRFTGDKIGIQANNIASPNEWKTDAVFRDHSAWYHIVCAIDTTNATAASRIKVYVNGVEQTFSQSPAVTQNSDLYVNAAVSHSIGKRDSSSTSNFDGYLADIYFIDGSALDATSFGAFDDNGVWQVATYSGTFGTNGFHLLDFANESTVGHDSSGNNNDFTANNISTTAGGGNDVLFDVPTNGSQSDSGAGGEVSGNYAVLNPLQAITNSPTNGNLEIGGTSTGTYTKSVSTIYIDPEDTTGYYCEFTVVTTGTNPAGHIQLIPQLNVTNNGKGETGGVGLGMRGSGAGNKWYKLTDQSSGTDTGVAHAANQVIGVAVKNGKLYMAINNTWVLSGNPATESNPLYSSLSGLKGFLCGTLDGSWQCNWGQRAFAYSAPSGYRPVSSAFLPTPTIADGSDYFDAKLYTGNGSTQSITGLSLSSAPDFVWIKSRSHAYDHMLFDSVRGAGKNIRSNKTNAEVTNTSDLSSFDSNGFTVGSGGFVNGNGPTFVAWCWDAGSSTVSNTDGSGTSNVQVRANTTAGFSIVTYTGGSSSPANSDSGDSFGHGLGVAPDLVICKKRTGTNSWPVYHRAAPTGALILDLTNANDSSSFLFAKKDPTSTEVFLGNNPEINNSSHDYVAYCFAPVAGYSHFSSWEGNGSSDGPFIYTGFRPRFALFKCTSHTNSWQILDTARDSFNEATKGLFPNLSNAEISNGDYDIDILSNGIKIRTSDSFFNGSGRTFLIAAFAENPFQANGGLAR